MNSLVIDGSGHVSVAVARAAAAKRHGVWAVTRSERPPHVWIVPLQTEDRHVSWTALKKGAFPMDRTVSHRFALEDI